MFPVHRIPHVMLAAGAFLAAAPVAIGQTPAAPPAAQAAAPQAPAAPPGPPPVYVPTSLKAEPGLPRTADGHPDFGGTRWTTTFFPVFAATPMAASLVVSEADAKKMADMMIQGMLASKDPNITVDPEIPEVMKHTTGLPVVRGERRSRLVVLPADGKVPWVPAARTEANALDWDKIPTDNPENRPTSERCAALAGLAPIPPAPGMNPIEIIQTRGYVVIRAEFGGETRIVPLTDHHGSPALQPRLGDAIAHWDGDTLVIETTNAPAQDRIRGQPKLIVGTDSKVIERFTRLSRDELLYQFTIEDPKVYTAPWLAEYSFVRSDKPIYEYACHEGNYSLPNILKAQREADARALAAPATAVAAAAGPAKSQ